MCSSYFESKENKDDSEFSYGRFRISLQKTKEVMQGMQLRKFKVTQEGSKVERKVTLIQETKWIDNRSPDFN